MLVERTLIYLRMIKFSHSVFALPFAFTAAVLAASGVPTLREILWITLAMVGGRSAAMGLNRIIDRKIDAMNPRTASREIPTGVVKVSEAVVFVLLSLALFVYSAYKLNPLCLKLSPVAIFFFIFYPYTKRFTWLSHIVLGIAISGAPIGAWIAIKGEFNFEILPLALAVIFWLAGFDILYALQDYEFDRKAGLQSIPRRFGIRRSLWLSRAFHLFTWLLLVLTGRIFGLGVFYYIGIIITAGLLLYEHSLVKEDDLSKLDIAFFNMNGYISITVFFFTFLDILL
jgi:4-hydroxybenzoate polyprenyltransferase